MNDSEAEPIDRDGLPTDEDGYVALIYTKPPDRERFEEWAGASGAGSDVWELLGPDGEVVERYEP